MDANTLDAGLLAILEVLTDGEDAEAPSDDALDRAAAIVGYLGGDADDHEEVPPVAQSKPWTCGAAAMRAVLKRHGIDADEAAVADALGTTEEGTSPDALESGAWALGLDAEGLHGMTPRRLEEEVAAGHAVVCCVQMHGGAEAVADEEAGHWVVLHKADPDGLVYMDPATGTDRTIGRAELLRVWRDRDADGVPYRRYGLVIKGKTGGGS